MELKEESRRRLLRHCVNENQLHKWIKAFTGLHVPRRAVCPGHQAPFEYICKSYFEPSSDLVVWAPRGGGKTRLAALATLLDLLHKPGCAVRILGGSLEQALHLWQHLLPNVEELVSEQLRKERRDMRRLKLKSGSNAAVLTQSERAVRGLRVQKLRCDEVELFKPEVWEAAQMVTRSIPSPNADDTRTFAGAIEAISTYHNVSGLMSKVVERAHVHKIPIFQWCLLEVLEKCPDWRKCDECPLWEDCNGVAKTQCDGFVHIDDAIAMKQRVSRETWEAEILCKRPITQGSVFPSFNVDVHVKESCDTEAHGSPSVGFSPARISLAIDFGFHAPFVCLWVHDDGTVCHVIDEYVQPQRTISDHVEQIESRPWGKVNRICCDPAGAGRNDQTAESNIQFLRRQGFSVTKKHSRIIEGLEMIRAALRPAFGKPRLFIHPRCTRLIAAMQQYRYPVTGGELPLKDGEHDHLADALRYFFVNRVRPSGPKSRSY